MLRASSQTSEDEVRLNAVMEANADSGIPLGAELMAYVEAVVARDHAAITSSRAVLLNVAGGDVVVDAAGVISNFQRMVRIADSTGIGLGRVAEPTAALRASLGIDAFSERT